MNLKSEFITVIIAFIFIGKYCSIPNIPCPSKFQYARSGDTNFGLITIERVYYGDTVVEVELSQPGTLDSDYAGNLQLNFEKEKIFDYIKSGSPVTYKVDFASQNVIPQVSAIRLNGANICSGSKVIAPSTTVTIKHTLTAPGSPNDSPPPPPAPSQSASRPNWPRIDWSSPSGNLPWLSRTSTSRPSFGYPSFLSGKITLPKKTFSYDSKNPFFNSDNQFQYVISPPSTTTQRPVYSPDQPLPFLTLFTTTSTTPPPTTTTTSTTTTTTTTTTTPRPIQLPFVPPASSGILPVNSNPTRDYINSVCGLENLNFAVKKLAVNGDVVAKSRFPWIVALFKKHIGTLAFQCGGNLISTRTVISAAHCFYSGYDRIRDEDILVSLGRHNLTDWSDDFIVQRDVDRVIQHPDYRPELENTDADLAIIWLTKTVPFSIAIRPVCMWKGPLDTRDIEGVHGIVVGWGRDERNNDLTTSPRLVTAAIVSEITCIRSNTKLFYLTSNRTLCAGDRNGSGPCNGDSGSGLIIKNRNRWMLRGTVSASLGDGVNQCNLDEYVVYTDIAKFLGWIHANMLL